MKANPKILGACVVGFALVAGSYVITNFGESRQRSTPTTDVYATTQLTAESRTYIEVTDVNQDGVEDWQEEFVNKTPLLIDTAGVADTAYKTPTTLTEQMSVQLFQSVLEAKGRGTVGPNSDQVISDTANILRQSAITDTIYTKEYLTVINSSPEAIRTYANTLAQIMLNNNIPGSESELTIIDRALKTENPEELKKLDPIIAMYKNMRDQTLKTPVPKGFEKQHLDLINVYQALFASLTDFKLVFNDPVVSLLRIKRYQDDATGLGNALQNMYAALVPYANLLQPNDPALIFAAFSPVR